MARFLTKLLLLESQVQLRMLIWFKSPECLSLQELSTGVCSFVWVDVPFIICTYSLAESWSSSRELGVSPVRASPLSLYSVRLESSSLE